jgi:hypothetical protein
MGDDGNGTGVPATTGSCIVGEKVAVLVGGSCVAARIWVAVGDGVNAGVAGERQAQSSVAKINTINK